MAHRSLAEFLASIRQAETTPRPDGEDWKALIERIHIVCKIHEVDGETYYWFLECLPPKYQNGSFFAFAEGAEPLKLFWAKGGSHFVRPLTWDETKEFCRLARIAIPR